MISILKKLIFIFILLILIKSISNLFKNKKPSVFDGPYNKTLLLKIMIIYHQNGNISFFSRPKR